MPLINTLAARSGQFFFDRSDPQARIRQSDEVNAALKRGESIVIYPEGTFTAMAGIRPFQLGAFKASVDSQRPICPVSVRGARQVLRDKTRLPRRGNVTITFNPLIFANPSAGEIIARNSGEPLL
jgi:1-acyl-sn-glycerol-3-phosphate acyltransferase